MSQSHPYAIINATVPQNIQLLDEPWIHNLNGYELLLLDQSPRTPRIPPPHLIPFSWQIPRWGSTDGSWHFYALLPSSYCHHVSAQTTHPHPRLYSTYAVGDEAHGIIVKSLSLLNLSGRVGAKQCVVAFDWQHRLQESLVL